MNAPRRGFALALAASMLAIGASAEAQRSARYRPSTAVVPQAITVGDVFHAAIRLDVASDVAVAFPDSLTLPPNVEAAGHREMQLDTTAEGHRVYTAVYPLTAWRPGPTSLPGTTLLVRDGGGDASVEATFPEFSIESVLPADTTGIQPKPAKDVLGANRVWWPLAVGAALLLALLALAYVVYRRRKDRGELAAPEPVLAPRELALAELDRARSSHILERGQTKEFYSIVSDALRRYVAALDERWSADLTTTELAGRMRGNAIDTEAAALLGLLGQSDLVKFARRRPAVAEAYGEWAIARAWVESFDWPPPPVVMEEAKAA